MPQFLPKKIEIEKPNCPTCEGELGLTDVRTSLPLNYERLVVEFVFNCKQCRINLGQSNYVAELVRKK